MVNVGEMKEVFMDMKEKILKVDDSWQSNKEWASVVAAYNALARAAGTQDKLVDNLSHVRTAKAPAPPKKKRGGGGGRSRSAKKEDESSSDEKTGSTKTMPEKHL